MIVIAGAYRRHPSWSGATTATPALRQSQAFSKLCSPGIAGRVTPPRSHTGVCRRRRERRQGSDGPDGGNRGLKVVDITMSGSEGLAPGTTHRRRRVWQFASATPDEGTGSSQRHSLATSKVPTATPFLREQM